MKKYSIILLIIFAACKSQSEEKKAAKPLKYEALQTQIDSIYNDHIGEGEPGAAVLVSYDGEMVIGKGYGLRDLDKQEPITRSTNMNTASLSKQFTALSILSLVDQGKLSLDDKVYQYFPYPIFENITIMQLINHTSGLPEYLVHFRSNWDPGNIVENQDVMDWLATSPEPHFQPGEKYEYCNTAYLVLALIVEKVSGEEFQVFARENVFKKAGMKNTNYFSLAKPIDIPERALSYEKDSLNRFVTEDGYFMDGVMGDGGVYTNVNDYFQYDLALRDKSILSENTHDLIFKPSAKVETFVPNAIEESGGDEAHTAMGWFVSDTTAVHTGGWYGTQTYVKRYLDRPLTIAILMNRNTLFSSDLIQKTDSLVLEHIKN